jgi:hypothetical protein
MYLEIRPDLLGSDNDLEPLSRILQELAGDGHRVEIRIEMGPGATAAQISTLLSWLDPVDGAVWRIEKRSAPPGLGSGLVYDLAVNVGSELVAGLMLAPQLHKLANALKKFRRAQPVPPDTAIVLRCDTVAEIDADSDSDIGTGTGTDPGEQDEDHEEYAEQ